MKSAPWDDILSAFKSMKNWFQNMHQFAFTVYTISSHVQTYKLNIQLEPGTQALWRDRNSNMAVGCEVVGKDELTISL
jgi:hypothetical protein